MSASSTLLPNVGCDKAHLIGAGAPIEWAVLLQ
jgi:hypothetical protein